MELTVGMVRDVATACIEATNARLPLLRRDPEGRESVLRQQARMAERHWHLLDPSLPEDTEIEDEDSEVDFLDDAEKRLGIVPFWPVLIAIKFTGPKHHWPATEELPTELGSLLPDNWLVEKVEIAGDKVLASLLIPGLVPPIDPDTDEETAVWKDWVRDMGNRAGVTWRPDGVEGHSMPMRMLDPKSVDPTIIGNAWWREEEEPVQNAAPTTTIDEVTPAQVAESVTEPVAEEPPPEIEEPPYCCGTGYNSRSPLCQGCNFLARCTDKTLPSPARANAIMAKLNSEVDVETTQRAPVVVPVAYNVDTAWAVQTKNATADSEAASVQSEAETPSPVAPPPSVEPRSIYFATVDAKPLSAALAVMRKVADSKCSTTILAHCYIKANASGHSIKISATDYDQWLDMDVPCSFADPDAPPICVNVEGLVGLIPKKGDVQLTIDIREQTSLLVECDGMTGSCPTMPAEDFPSSGQEGFTWTRRRTGLTAADVKDIISRFEWGVCTDPARLNINGLYFQQEAGELTYVATQGHTMEAETIKTGSAKDPWEMILLRVGLPTLARLCDKKLSPGDVQIHTGVKKMVHDREGKMVPNESSDINEALFIGDTWSLRVRCIEEKFPEYQRVIPPDRSLGCLVNRETFDAALSKIEAVTKKQRISLCKLSRVGDNIQLVAGYETKTTILVPCRDWTFCDESEVNKTPLGWNPSLVRGALKTLGNHDNVRFFFPDGFGPTLFLPENDETTKVVVMPVKV